MTDAIKKAVTRQGVVVRKSGLMTVVVRIDQKKRHPKYKKTYSVSKKYLVHDATNSAVVGSKVTIALSKPLSRHKRWTIVAA